MSLFTRYYLALTNLLDYLAPIIPLLALRLILAWEFGESGYEKLTGDNWFADVSFPFPFNLLPADISWNISIWFEIGGAIALILGLGTRFVTISLMILTVVAISAVHWPEHWNTLGELLKGYRIVDEDGDGFGNYKLPAIYLFMFVPLLFSGPGKLSIDYLIKNRIDNK
ncbi:MAG TPA: DoxX family protein [Methylophilaceae bacterium]|nr:DoxX family protein [Methylophilaceae bacterium]